MVARRDQDPHPFVPWFLTDSMPKDSPGFQKQLKPSQYPGVLWKAINSIRDVRMIQDTCWIYWNLLNDILLSGAKNGWIGGIQICRHDESKLVDILPILTLSRKWEYLVEIFYEKKRRIFVEEEVILSQATRIFSRIAPSLFRLKTGMRNEPLEVTTILVSKQAKFERHSKTKDMSKEKPSV